MRSRFCKNASNTASYDLIRQDLGTSALLHLLCPHCNSANVCKYSSSNPPIHPLTHRISLPYGRRTCIHTHSTRVIYRCVCIYIYTHICVYAQIISIHHTFIMLLVILHAHVHACVHVYLYLSLHIYIYICTYVCLHMHMKTRMYRYICV